jgi:hypothetical protein
MIVKSNWYESVYRRAVVDMHITADDERFMSQYDPDVYVAMVKKSRAGSAVVYAHSHVGLCYFPTRVGTMHPGLKGRDILAEVIERCHANDIAVVAYASAIFDTWAYRNHPDWKITGHDGQPVAEQSRYGVCCPNAPYRNYIAALGAEIATNYDVDGMRFDMTFWPTVCYCRHCRERFGADLPTAVHWEDTNWVAFQRAREAWLVDFARNITAAVKQVKPEVSVEHQASTYTAGWQLGVTTPLAEQNDFLQGDFYGDALQGSFARKLFYNLTPRRPGGFETCVSVDLGNYTALKSEHLLRAKAHAALSDGSAFIFIDSINPTGTLNAAVYERMGRVFAESQRYEPYLGGERAQDVAVYLSTESKYDFADNGKAMGDAGFSGRMPHVEAAVSACKSLIDHHIPYGVITRRNLGELARHKVVVLPNVLMMSEDEAAALRTYVANGGCLYASSGTSLLTSAGQRLDDFMLADVFGVARVGETKERFTYMAPAAGSEGLFDGYTIDRPLGLYASQLVVKAQPGAEVLGVTVLPYTDPADPRRFASIHNNPPGIYTDSPAIVRHRFGNGQAIYVTAELESYDPYREIFTNLIRLMVSDFAFEADAPRAVEVTLFEQPEQRRAIINLINFQHELPNIPVDGIRVRVRLNGRAPRRLLLLNSRAGLHPAQGEREGAGYKSALQGDHDPLDYKIAHGLLEFTVPRVETFAMFALEYEP